MTATAVTAADLRPIDLFDDLDDAALAEFAAVAERRDRAAGEVVGERGDQPGVLLLLDGTIGTYLPDPDGRMEPTGRHHAPTWLGAISVLTGGLLGVQARAETACAVARIPAEDFRRLAFAHVAVHDRVMRQVAPVMSRVSAIEHNREHLASLGTMAAGLAHELNNPAAAAQRAAAQMADALEVVSATIGRFVHSGISREDAGQLVTLHDEAIARAAERDDVDTLAAADAEDALLERLEHLGVPEPWQLAEPLAAAGVDDAWLARVAALAGPATDAALGWVAASLTARGLATELQESTERMSNLVSAVKTYAYMDRGELVEVDLHEGLKTTLVVLGHKLKHTSIELVKDYDKTLPKLTVRGSELNQVWTNLLDNAIQAVGDRGTITIRTRREEARAVVEITDDGPGIPPEIRERIFDSFFTTKAAGQGTGLGLATAWRIVVDRHDGSLTVDSEPGRTTFRVALPFTRD
jgi:signal transduction histidine kinase